MGEFDSISDGPLAESKSTAAWDAVMAVAGPSQDFTQEAASKAEALAASIRPLWEEAASQALNMAFDGGAADVGRSTSVLTGEAAEEARRRTAAAIPEPVMVQIDAKKIDCVVIDPLAEFLDDVIGWDGPADAVREVLPPYPGTKLWWMVEHVSGRTAQFLWLPAGPDSGRATGVWQDNPTNGLDRQCFTPEGMREAGWRRVIDQDAVVNRCEPADVTREQRAYLVNCDLKVEPRFFLWVPNDEHGHEAYWRTDAGLRFSADGMHELGWRWQDVVHVREGAPGLAKSIMPGRMPEVPGLYPEDRTLPQPYELELRGPAVGALSRVSGVWCPAPDCKSGVWRVLHPDGYFVDRTPACMLEEGWSVRGPDTPPPPLHKLPEWWPKDVGYLPFDEMKRRRLAWLGDGHGIEPGPDTLRDSRGVIRTDDEAIKHAHAEMKRMAESQHQQRPWFFMPGMGQQTAPRPEEALAQAAVMETAIQRLEKLAARFEAMSQPQMVARKAQSRAWPGGTRDYTREMVGGEMLNLCGSNAYQWATAFCQHADKLGHTGIDLGWMVGWFANAMCRALDEDRWKREKAVSTSIAEVVKSFHGLPVPGAAGLDLRGTAYDRLRQAIAALETDARA